MFTLSPLPKQVNKIKSKDSDLIIPNNWVDFARMTKIRSAGNIVYFNPFDYQIELVNMMIERSVIIAKSRQLGISEVTLSFMLWRACLNPGYLGLVFSKNQKDSSLLAKRVIRMIESLGLKTSTENLCDIEIEGKGRILFRNSKPESARGIESVVDVYLDEYSWLERAKEIFDAVAPAQQMLGDKARTFIVSTPNGQSGHYWDLLNTGNGNLDIELLCQNISNGSEKPFYKFVDSGNWGKILISYKAHPIYGKNPNFLQEIHEKQKLSWSTIYQEYNLSFQESEANYFNADIIRNGAKGEVEKPIKEGVYYLGIDTSTTGEDYCVGTVIRKIDDAYSLVHLYRKKQESSQYHLYHLGNIINEYMPEVVGIEVTGGTGQIYLENLTKSHKNISFEAIRTTGDSKPAMLDRLKLLLESEKFTYPKNSPIIDELLNFKRQGKKLEAAQGKHDDIIMAVSFALAVAKNDNTWSLKDVPRL